MKKFILLEKLFPISKQSGVFVVVTDLCLFIKYPQNRISTRNILKLSHKIKENLFILWKLCAFKKSHQNERKKAENER